MSDNHALEPHGGWTFWSGARPAFAWRRVRYVGDVGIEWSSDVDQGLWWTDRLHPFAEDVGSFLPDTFDAYARVFHPVVGSESTRHRWSDIASITGRVVHPEMQFDPIATMADGTGRLPTEPPPDGSLTRDGLQSLARILAEHLDTTAELVRDLGWLRPTSWWRIHGNHDVRAPMGN